MLFVNDVQQTGPVALLLYGLIALTIGLMLLELLWQVIGKEVVEISDDALVIKHHILGLGPAKKFLADKISAVQVSQQNEWARGLGARRDYRFFNFKRGWVALHSGKSLTGRPVTYRFGTRLDEGEAQQVVAQIISRFPQYKAESRPVDSQPSA